jgi:hypothetical protein
MLNSLAASAKGHLSYTHFPPVFVFFPILRNTSLSFSKGEKICEPGSKQDVENAPLMMREKNRLSQ